MRALLLAAALACETLPLAASAPPTEIWFAPRLQKMEPFNGGSRPIDYSALFQPGAPGP